MASSEIEKSPLPADAVPTNYVGFLQLDLVTTIPNNDVTLTVEAGDTTDRRPGSKFTFNLAAFDPTGSLTTVPNNLLTVDNTSTGLLQLNFSNNTVEFVTGPKGATATVMLFLWGDANVDGFTFSFGTSYRWPAGDGTQCKVTINQLTNYAQVIQRGTQSEKVFIPTKV
jgi:hypothetical protein